jgi:DNA-binding NarL/FixJ family response regulator
MSKTKKSLTTRQMEVLQLVANHLTNTEIALQLGLSHKTVELHISAAMKRLGARNRHHAVQLARKLGLL